MKAHVQLDPLRKQAKVVLKLSERNLLTMLSKLASESSKTIFNTMVVGDEDWIGMLVLQAECDCLHYKDRIPAGDILHEAELFVEKVQSGQKVDALVPLPPRKPCGCS